MNKGKDQQPQAIFVVCLHFLILLYNKLRVSLLSPCNAFFWGGGVADTFEKSDKSDGPSPQEKKCT